MRPLSAHHARTVQFFRDLCVGVTLTRTSDREIARRFFLDALRGFQYPEFAWMTPCIHFMLAYEHATQGRGVKARQAIQKANDAIAETSIIAILQELWIELSIPVWTYAELPAHRARLNRARKLLVSITKEPRSVSVVLEASRLAVIVAQHDEDLKLALIWLSRLRTGLKKAGQFGIHEQSEYHMQRLSLFNRLQLTVRGIHEARTVLVVSKVGSVHWYNGASILVNLLLKTEKYSEAFDVAQEVLYKNGSSKRASEFSLRMNLRATYARVMSGQSVTGLRLHTIAKHYPLDLIILQLLIGKRRRDLDTMGKAISSLKRHLARKQQSENHPLLVLLSELLISFDKSGYNITSCRKQASFLDAEENIDHSAIDETYRAVLTPKAIWKAVTSS